MDVKMKSLVAISGGGSSALCRNGSITSKTSVLNHILLRAWRERWSDAQFGIHIKTVLPRGVSGDVYNLADCILQQALVGSDANKLVLSYLRHSLCSHLISHAAVLKRIAKYDRFENEFCVIALLDFLEVMLGGITCRSKPEEAMLSNAVLSLVYWLAEAYKHVLDQNRLNNGLRPEQTEMAERCTVVLDLIIHHQFMRAVIVVAMHEDPELFAELRASYLHIKNDTLNTGFVLAATVTSRDRASTAAGTNTGAAAVAAPLKSFEELLKSAVRIGAADLPAMCAASNAFYESMAYCLQPLLTVKVLQNPHAETRTYVADLQMIRQMKNYSMSRLYYELLRACMMSLMLSSPTTEAIWCAFTFIKLPQVIRELSFGGMAGRPHRPRGDPKLGHCPDVVAALKLLAEDAVLDNIDTKCACNTIEYLLTELRKHGLVGDEHVKALSDERADHTAALAKIDYHNSTSIIRFVICAETPFTGILKALGADYSKMQEPLLGMFVQVLSGNSLELILSVASVEGKLRTFVARLINCNEQSLHAEAAEKENKCTTVKASLFDVSFLMLTCIVQTYGSAAVLEPHRSSSSTFFERWVRECMIERTRHKSAMSMIQRRAPGDPNRVDELLLHMGVARLSTASSASSSPTSAASAAAAAAAIAAASSNSAGSGGTSASTGDAATAAAQSGGSGTTGSAGLTGSGAAASSPLSSCPHVPWQEVCLALPGVLHHILLAWESDSISAADVKFYLDAIKSRMCAFSVCAASWLNAYTLVVRDGELVKPLHMLKQLMQPVAQPDELTQKENYQERHMLAVQIMRKMEQDGAAVLGGGSGGPMSGAAAAAQLRGAGANCNLASVRPIAQHFDDMWNLMVRRGGLPLDASRSLEAMLQSCGAFWLVSRLLEKILACKFAKEMLVTMDIVFALMHVQIERCTVALLSEWLPMLLMNRLQSVELLAPHSGVLARLCVMCILATMDTSADPASSTMKRRHSPSGAGIDAAAAASAADDDATTTSPATAASSAGAGDLDMDSVGPMLKARKIDTGVGNTDDPNATISSGDFLFDMVAPLNRTPPLVVQEPLQCTLVQLFRQFGHFLCVDQLSPKIYFISQFLQLLVQLGGDQVKPLLRLAPGAMMQNLLRVTVCDEYTAGFILRVYDLDTVSGRRSSMTDLSLLRNIELRNDSIDL